MNRDLPALLQNVGLLTVVGAMFGVPVQSRSTHGIDMAAMDRSVKPAEDFYLFANGKWLAATTIPPDRSQVDSFTLVIDRTRLVLGQILEEAARDGGTNEDSITSKVGSLYRSGMDVHQREAAGARPLEPLLKKITAIQGPGDLLPTLVMLHSYRVFAGFRFAAVPDLKDSSRIIAELSQGGIGLPDRAYYLKDDEKSQSLRRAYRTHVAKMLELLGDEPAAADTGANAVLEFESRLARASRSRADIRDPQKNYHLLEFGALEKESGISWASYFEGLGVAPPKRLNVPQPAFIHELGRLITETSLDTWKIYLRWQLAHGLADSLSSAFEKENFHFFGTLLHGVPQMQTRSQRVQEDVDDLLAEALGQLYVAHAYSPETRTRTEALVADIRATLRQRLENLEWMSPQTRREALRKLDAMRVKIGHPTKWRDYSELRLVRPVFAENVLAARAFQARWELNKIDRPVDREEWEVKPQTVNAYYKESRNEIVLPAAIWQPPFFDPQADDAVNYGAIGMIIGHEMTHAFDDRGRQFDADGNLRDWWTPADSMEYEKRAARMVKQFDAYVAIDDLHVNGRLTLGENIADLGGLTIAFVALKKKLPSETKPKKMDGFTQEQRFFLAFAQVWRAKLRPEYLRFKIQISDHTQGRYRVLGPLANMPEFFEVFGIPAGEMPKWRNSQPVRIW
jgi:predicted metalloendopeptidase